MRVGSPLVLLAALAPLAAAQEPRARVGEPPAWVEPLPLDELLGAPDHDAPDLVLLDTQVDARDDDVEHHQRFVRRLGSQVAIRTGSQVELAFDPSYQELVVHRLVVHRGGEVIDRLDLDQAQMIRAEAEADSQVYDGSYTLVLFVRDVRLGDVLECAYTLRGWNPVFAGWFQDQFGVRWSEGVRRFRYRLLWPAERHLGIRGHGIDLQPTSTPRGDHLEVVWSAEHVPELVVDEHVPLWYVPFPWVQVSSFRSWEDVVAWALPLYAAPGPSGQLAAAVEELSAAGATPGERALAALRFVQDEIRYLGFEMGPGSHAPSDPAAVLERRFGDCKDKSLLLVTLLRALGVDAAPAFVHTVLQEHVQELYPSPYAFNHVVVRARLGGVDHWMDPTQLAQRGGLDDLRRSWFGRALVVEPGSRGLAEVPEDEMEEPQTVIQARFEIDPDADHADLRIETVHRKGVADAYRQLLQEASVAALSRSFVEHYARVYPRIEALEQASFTDDEQRNEVRIVESYRVPDFWYREPQHDDDAAEFFALDVQSALPAPVSPKRTMPLGVPYPTHIRYEVQAHRPGGWSLDPTTDRVRAPALAFDRTVRAQGELLTIRYDYRTRADHVSPENAPRYVDALDEAHGLLSYAVWRAQEPYEELGRLEVLVAAVVVLVGAAGSCGAVWVVVVLLERRRHAG